MVTVGTHSVRTPGRRRRPFRDIWGVPGRGRVRGERTTRSGWEVSPARVVVCPCDWDDDRTADRSRPLRPLWRAGLRPCAPSRGRAALLRAPLPGARAEVRRCGDPRAGRDRPPSCRAWSRCRSSSRALTSTLERAPTGTPGGALSSCPALARLRRALRLRHSLVPGTRSSPARASDPGLAIDPGSCPTPTRVRPRLATDPGSCPALAPPPAPALAPRPSSPAPWPSPAARAASAGRRAAACGCLARAS